MRRMKYFEGKTVWLTGASGGIGAALAAAFARDGANLILSGRNTDKIDAIGATLASSFSGEYRTLFLDLAQTDDHVETARKARSLFGSVDVFVNNAGISQRSLVHETSYEVIEKLMRVNFLGGAALTIETLKDMYQRGGGHIVALSSIMGLFSTPLRSGYCAAKHAIQGFYESLSHEASHHGVAVTIIVPGWIQTDIAVNALEGDGTRHAIVDPGQAAARGPEAYAGNMVNAIARRKFFHYTALNWKTRAALLMNRYTPRLLHSAVRRLDVT